MLLLDLLEAHRATALFVTHNLPEAIMLADRLVFLGGRPARILAEQRASRSTPRSAATRLPSRRCGGGCWATTPSCLGRLDPDLVTPELPS